MKRSSEAFWWSLFSAGGVMSALFVPALVFTTGFGLPFFAGDPAESYEPVHAVASFWLVRLALLGGSERMDAAEAHRLGLVGEVLPAERLMPRARELAAKIAEHSPTALARTKRAIWESLDLGLEPGLDRAWELVQRHNDHPDLVEGTQAFVEKRAARYALLRERAAQGQSSETPWGAWVQACEACGAKGLPADHGYCGACGASLS